MNFITSKSASQDTYKHVAERCNNHLGDTYIYPGTIVSIAVMNTSSLIHAKLTNGSHAICFQEFGHGGRFQMGASSVEEVET